MKRLFLAPALGALALATASPAFAQYGRPDPRRPSYGSSRYSEVGRLAYDNGFREGIEEGEKDVRARDRFYYEDEGDFKNGDKGYSRSYGDKNMYRQTFRAGFSDGYAEGYNRYSRGYDSGRYGGYGGYGQGGGYGAAAFEIGQRDGYEKGREDARGRTGFDPRRHRWYRDGDREYNGRYGSREQYKDEYRRGFTAGYQQGFRGR